MSARDFLLPDLGEGLTEGTITRWQVAVGDRVTVDQPVVEVETAKAVVDVPCPFEGQVTALHADVGQEIRVGERLMTVASEAGQDTSGPSAPPEPAEPAEPGAAPEATETGQMVPEPAPAGDGDSGGSVLVGYGTGGGPRQRRRRSSHEDAPSPPDADAGAPRDAAGRPLAKPPVRKLAKDLGVDLSQVEASGAGGVITRDDVHAAAPGSTQAAEPAAAPRAPAAAGDERIPLTGVRKAIAERVTISRRDIPEATAWVDCDVTEVVQLRDELNAAQEHVRVSPFALILRATVAALRRHPELNSALDVDAQEIVRHHAVHLGVAVQTSRGLLVPVVRDADRRSTLQLAAELRRLTDAAREATISPDELSGSTFSVSNYGAFGVDGGNPVINHPEAAILGVGQIADRPWVVGDPPELAVRKVCQLSVAFDHRICDGGEAAGFLRFLADCLESRSTLLGAL